MGALSTNIETKFFLHVSKFVARFRFFKRFKLIGGPKKKSEAPFLPHLERGPGLSPIRPYVKMALVMLE